MIVIDDDVVTCMASWTTRLDGRWPLSLTVTNDVTGWTCTFAGLEAIIVNDEVHAWADTVDAKVVLDRAKVRRAAHQLAFNESRDVLALLEKGPTAVAEYTRANGLSWCVHGLRVPCDALDGRTTVDELRAAVYNGRSLLGPGHV